jgi:formylglycine-generating enzyme required for sulfatase activity
LVRKLLKKGLFFLCCVCVLCFPSISNGNPKIIKNSIGMEFVLIPAGSFMMGADRNFEDAFEDELPQHKVVISRSFYIGEYEVTQAQWVAIMGNNPSKFKDRKRPVEQVAWDDVKEFIHILNKKEKTNAYRLPTEAEWEYAARAGSDTTYCFGDDPDDLSQYAWINENSGKKTHPVAKLKKNAWGIYDMHGNVWEWCQDNYGDKYYSNSPLMDPKGPSKGSLRVGRGGSWSSDARHCRSAVRYHDSQGDRDPDVGFRLIWQPE